MHEKEVLLREIHHRVKNNLTVIHSLLNLHLQKSPDQAQQFILEGARNRLWSMVLVHDLLYRSENLAEISSLAYLNKLIDQLIVFLKLQQTADLSGKKY
jgi:two-component sensor histidine kinase